eukprot:gene36858-44712_t
MYDIDGCFFDNYVLEDDSLSLMTTTKAPESSKSSSPSSLTWDEHVDLTDWLAGFQERVPEHSSSAILSDKKPRRIRNRLRAHPFPRVLKVDIRRKYPMMLVNVVNSSDPELMCRFFSQFCVPSCQLCDSVLHPLTREKKQVFVRSGLPEIHQFAYEKASTAAPDFIMQLRSACVKQSNVYAGSKLALQVEVRAHAASFCNFFEIACNTPENLSIVTGVMDALAKKYKTKCVQAFNDVGFVGNLTITLDVEHRFEKLEMEADFFLANSTV